LSERFGSHFEITENRDGQINARVAGGAALRQRAGWVGAQKQLFGVSQIAWLESGLIEHMFE
jgi:hypothetical protein